MLSSALHFRDLPISKKLTLFCVIISLVSLVTATVVIIIYDRYSLEEIIQEELTVLATVIGNRSSAAIVFDDKELALNNLESLKFQDSIESACIYKVENDSQDIVTTTRLASYPTVDIRCPTLTPQELTITDSADSVYTELVKPIELDDNIIGYLYLQFNNAKLTSIQNNHVKVLLLVSAMAALMAFYLARIFARWISGPLLILGKTARAIASKDDYSIRAQKFNNDEVGLVVDSFNHMLDVIQRDNESLRESEEKFRLISASSKVGIYQVDANGNCVYCNDEMSKITGLGVEEILAGNWLSVVHEDDAQIIKSKWNTMLKDRREINFSCRLQTSHTQWVNGHIGMLHRADGQLIGFLGTLNDITSVKNAQVQLEQMAFYDTLTGLANRRLFRNRLEHVVNNLNRDGSRLGLILIDLDQFKNINDSLGHDAGDSLLMIIAERLQLCVRASDTVSRLGGDEFAIILPGISSSLAVSHVAQKILDTLKKPIILQEIEITISASAGISMAPDDSDNAETLIKNADLALYRAKDQGRDNYQFFTSEMNTRLVDHLKLIEDLRYAVDQNQFSLVFQPQIELRQGKIIGYESLIRWNHPVRGTISPFDFIPAAEETGLIIPLGRWVIDNACRQLKALCDQQLANANTIMTVNLSVKQFQDDELVSYIEEKINEHKLKPNQFEVELTETVLMENLDDALVKLNAIKDLGILISIDDFGTGYSSLGYLKQLPVNIVKVDRSFVMDIPDNTDDMEITAAVIAMAHNLNYEVVAEGVETQEQLSFLIQCGCDYGQGYLFSRPLPSDELIEFCINYQPERHIGGQDD